MTKPTIQKLDEYLKDLVHWERFALHLPEVDQTDINIIKKNKRDDVVDQKLGLYETWLQVYPNASWDDVIQALEKVKENTIASNLREIVTMAQAAMSRKQPEVHEQVTNEGNVQVQESVVDELQKLHSEFVSLTKKVKSEVKREVESDETSLEDFVEHIEEQRAFNIEFHTTQTTDQFFKAIKPHYNFLNCYLLVTLAALLSQAIACKAKQYSDKTRCFMKETKIRDLHKKLEHYFQSFPSNDSVKVTITLENAWGTQSVWLVKQLVQQLLCLEHPDQCQWFRITTGCMLLILTAPKQKTCLLKNSKKKLQFMRLIGVISLQIGECFVLQEEENDMFSFENSLIQATVDDNIEAVQFLLQHIQINVNAQATQPIIETPPADLYKKKSFVKLELEEFYTTFTVLIKDVELELRNAVQKDEKSVEMLKCTEFPNSFKTTDEFFQACKAHSTFLNPDLIVNLAPLLPSSLAQRIKHYSLRTERLKTYTKFTYLHKSLEQHLRTEASNSVNITMALENAWCACSMHVVEWLLQSIFSPTHLNMLRWFRVDTESVIVFLAPEHLEMSLIENSMKKIGLMTLTGVVSLQIGEFNAFKKEINHTYSFKEGFVQAKSLGDNEALQLLLQINQAPLALQSISKTDENCNYHIYPEPDSTALMIACCNDNTEMVKLLLDNHADPNVQNGRKYTALMYASRNHKTFHLLLNHDADISQFNTLNHTTIYLACVVGNVKVVEILLASKKHFIGEKDIIGLTPLHKASYNGHQQVVEQLLQAQADPNIQDNKGITPLYGASQKGKVDIVERLLLAQTDPNTANKNGETPLYTASCNGHRQVVEQLLLAQADPNISTSDGLTPLHMASYNGHQQVVEQLLQAHADPNTTNTNGQAPNIDPNIRDNNGITPLYMASYNGHREVVEQLLQAQADPNIQDNDGETPLYGASQEGKVDIVEQLLQAQVNPNTATNDGQTPLYIASHNGHQRVVEQLLQAQADSNIRNNKGKTPLYGASQKDEVDIVEQLLLAQADPNIRDNDGGTPLHIASQEGKLDIVQQLLQAHADPNISTIDGRTPLYIASQEGQLQVIEQLLLAQADPNVRDNDGGTPLHIASQEGKLDIVQQLLQAHADPNISTIDGRTPLYIASQKGQLQVIEQLLLAQADPSIRANDYRTPLDVAIDCGYSQVVDILLQVLTNS